MTKSSSGKKSDKQLNKAWQKSDANSNFILRGEGFFISYNPSPVKSNFLETALVDIRNLPDRPIYILKGDHRIAYEALFETGFDACFSFYQSQQAKF